MKILGLGDIMPGGILSNTKLEISDEIKLFLNSHDVRIATLESTIASDVPVDRYKYDDEGEVCVWSHSEDLKILQYLDINIVSLANNHIGDFGEDGLLRVMKELDDLGIRYCGAGRNFFEASQPVVLESDDKTYAFLGMCQRDSSLLGVVNYADKDNWGVLEINENAIQVVKDCKSKYDYVYVLAHWGLEFKWIPEDSVIGLAKKLMDAGADCIFGGHPHHIQPVIYYNKKPIYYSLGNFIFPQICIDKKCNVYYPFKEEEEKLIEFNRFPIYKKFQMKYYWTKMGQLGMLAVLNTETNKATYRLSRLKGSKINFSIKSLSYVIKYWGAKFLTLNVSKERRKIIRKYISLVDYLYTYKVKSILNKKYRFYHYIKTIKS